MRKNESGLYEVAVDGQKYEFEKWGADESTDTILDIAAIVGKPLGMAIGQFFNKDGLKKDSLDKDIDPDMIGTIMEALTDKIGTNKTIIKALIKKLASEKVMCDGVRIVFNTHYQDRLDHLFRVVRAALEVQYGNFFGAVLGASGISQKGLTNRVLPT